MSRSRDRRHPRKDTSSSEEQVFIEIKKGHKRDSSSSSSKIESYSNKHKKHSNKHCKKESDKHCKKESNKHKKDSCKSEKKDSHKSEKKNSCKSEKKDSSQSEKKSSCKSEKKCRRKDSSSSEKKRRHRSSSHSSTESHDECSFDEIYKYYKCRLVKDEKLMVAGSTSYISAVNNAVVVIPRTSNAPFNTTGLTYNAQHGYVNSPFYIREDGMYVFNFGVNSDQASQFTLFINGIEESLTRCGNNSGAGQLILRTLLKLKANDAILVRNSESSQSAIECQLYVGGKNSGNNLSFTLVKVAPYENVEKEHWDEDCLSRKKKHLFKKLMEKMLCDKELMLKNNNVYGSFYTTVSQTVLTEGDVVFDSISVVNGLQWNPTGSNPEQIKVLEDGVFQLGFLGTNSTALQLSFTLNGVPIDSTTQGLNRGAAQISVRTLLELKKGDIVTIRNHISNNGEIILSQNTGGALASISAILVMVKVAPLHKADTKECDISKHYKKYYEKFRQYLLNQKCLQIEGSTSYMAVSNDILQELTVDSPLDWNNTLVKRHIVHVNGTTTFQITEDGVYEIYSSLASFEPPQVALFVNGTPNMATIFGRDSGGGRLGVNQLLKLYKGDVLTLNNYESHSTLLSTASNAGGNKVGQNCVFNLLRLCPLPKEQEEPKYNKPKNEKPTDKADKPKSK